MVSPIIPRLLPTHYLEPRQFELEITRLYERAWHLACLQRDVSERDEYVVVRVGRRDVLVQNVGDGLRAFSNVCPHRFSAIRSERRGRAELRCPYHLWTFDHEGIPCGIPHRNGVELHQLQTESLSLEKWQLATVGELVFVALDPDRSLTAFLGTLAPRITEFASNFAEEVDTFEHEIRANWKIVIQNTLEFDHAISVHQETFARVVKRPISLEELAATAPNIAYHAAMRDDGRARKMVATIDALFARTAPERIPGYAHILLFPSTTIGTGENRVVSVITYRPTAPDRTEMTARAFLLEIPDLSTDERVLRDAVVSGEITFARKLFEEDRIACESVQRGMEQAPPKMRGVLLPREYLVDRFQEFYVRALPLDAPVTR